MFDTPFGTRPAPPAPAAGGQLILTKNTLDNWRHMLAIARAWVRNPSLEADRLWDAGENIAAASADVGRHGGTLCEVLLYGGEVVAAYEAQHPGMLDAYRDRYGMTDQVGDILQLLSAGHTSGYSRTVNRLYDAGTAEEVLVALLVALAGFIAQVDPSGTNMPFLVLDATDPGPWEPNPRALPDIRRRLAAFMATDEAVEDLATAVLGFSPSEPEDVGKAAGAILAHREAERLAAARLYFADTDTTAVAIRKAGRVRKTPLSADRIPGPGLIVFQTPIVYAPGMPPVVAASWGPFPETPVEEGLQDFQNEPMVIGDRLWMIACYSQRMAEPGRPPLIWRGSSFLRLGSILKAPEPDTSQLAVRTVVACWDLITQELVGKPVTDIEQVQRKPAKARSDRRRGITDNGTVRLITIRGRRPAAPPRPRESDDTDGPTRRYDKWRWTVTEHTRDHCMNPHAHADGQCTHQDITVLDYQKGPENAPLLDTVRMLKAADQKDQ